MCQILIIPYACTDCSFVCSNVSRASFCVRLASTLPDQRQRFFEIILSSDVLNQLKSLTFNKGDWDNHEIFQVEMDCTSETSHLFPYLSISIHLSNYLSQSIFLSTCIDWKAFTHQHCVPQTVARFASQLTSLTLLCHIPVAMEKFATMTSLRNLDLDLKGLQHNGECLSDWRALYLAPLQTPSTLSPPPRPPINHFLAFKVLLERRLR